MTKLQVGDYVLPTLQKWIDKGFTEPKRIFKINTKSNCAHLGDTMNACYVGYLKKVDINVVPLFHKAEISIMFQMRNLKTIGFNFGQVLLNIGSN